MAVASKQYLEISVTSASCQSGGGACLAVHFPFLLKPKQMASRVHTATERPGRVAVCCFGGCRESHTSWLGSRTGLVVGSGVLLPGPISAAYFCQIFAAQFCDLLCGPRCHKSHTSVDVQMALAHPPESGCPSHLLALYCWEACTWWPLSQAPLWSFSCLNWRIPHEIQRVRTCAFCVPSRIFMRCAKAREWPQSVLPVLP